ncbi:o-succinylbenzoate synthase [Pontibacter silvestris]|uniref:O-succinylbenzoate synthase n=1 Tax=Pontibacter silvestris TaxID=2305183 RepID=A0ABW4X0J8_9BACT|nr:o-succinylbenzoate synthase [Pontibacter silvestris]MCC9135191.1 o-succinylbenzoate synthase [Pontibacter silvestris]
MNYRLRYTPHTLNFKFDARTSRGAISQHQVYYLELWKEQSPEITGVGECAPLAGLSIDYRSDIEDKLQEVCDLINNSKVLLDLANTLPEELALLEWPAIRFALETALLDLANGGRHLLYDTTFTTGEQGIPINGLIWMGDKSFMQEQIKKKLKDGYNCLKLKIGGLSFETELEILQRIRETAGAADLTIRVDANGAFKPDEAFTNLERLAKYEIHSIEQPIRQGQLEHMQQLCAYTPVPIALDEELIGVQKSEEKLTLLQHIKPQYIILKPTLVGGLQASREWIQLAEKQSIGWWVTSALESNIGLNAISQFTATYNVAMSQGLGTGQLYYNNIASPLQIEQGRLWYQLQQQWGLLRDLG